MALKKHTFVTRPPAAPDTHPTEPASCPEVVAPPVPVAAPPVFVADAGVLLYHDRAGKAIGVGLTEGHDNFHTITEHARSVLPQE